MQSAKTLAKLQNVLTALNPSLSLEAMLSGVAQQLVEMFGVDHSGMLLFGDADGEGVVIAEYPSHDIVGLTVPLTGYPLLDQIKRDRCPAAVFDAQHDPAMGSARTTMKNLGIQSILIIPLVVRGKIVGSLSLDAIERSRRFTAAEIEMCEIIGKQIAVAVDYTFSLEKVEQSRRQAQTLREVNRVLSETLDLEAVLPLILEQLEKVLPVDGSSIYLRVDGGVQMKAWRGKTKPDGSREVIPLEKLWGAAEIFNSRQAVLVQDTGQHPHWNVYRDATIKSWLGAPLTVCGEVVGVLNMNGKRPNQFCRSHIQLATDFANQAAIAIHNANLYGQATKRAELLASLQEIGVGIASSLDLEHVLRTVSTSVLALLDAHYVRFFLYNQASDSFSLVAALNRGGELSVVPANPDPPRKDGLTAQVARQGKLVAIADTRAHPLYRDTNLHSHVRAVVGVPLKKRAEVVGVLSVSYRQPHRFTAAEIDVLALLATQAAVALENARLYDLQITQIEQELAIAREIQQGFLPQEIPSIPGWRIAACCLPARETAGDFYEFVRRLDNQWGLAIGDVSGKSIQAAMLMGAAQSVVAAKGSDHRLPARVLSETNRLLYEDVPDGSFVAVSYLLLASQQGTVRLSNAGQLAPFLVPAAPQVPLRLVETPGLHWPLGIFEALEYQDLSFSLQAGDLLVFFTDGLAERMNSRREIFGFEGIAQVLRQQRGHSPERVLRALLRAAEHFSGGLPAHDDVTLLIVQRVKSEA